MPQASSDLTSIISPLQVPTTVYNGQVTIAATAKQLSTTSVPIKSVTIENLDTNAVVYVGDVNVAAGTGYALRPGATVSIDIANLNAVYVIGTAGDVITYIAVN